jgi:hypothetical protein
VDLLLHEAIIGVDKLIQIIQKKTSKTMVCSQLVYQIYEDCGEDYHIEIVDGLMQNALDAQDGSICLADLAKSAPEIEAVMPPLGAKAALENVAKPDSQAIARELYEALGESSELAVNGPDTTTDMSAVDMGIVVSLTKRFLDKLEEFLEKSEANIPINALFIAPSDILYKSKNLTNLGEFQLERQ